MDDAEHDGPDAGPGVDATRAAGGDRPGPGWFLEVAVIVVAFNFAVAQPLLDLLGRNAEFFVARDAQKIDVYLLAFALTLALPLVPALLLVGLRSISRPVASVAHGVTLAAILAVFGLRLVKQVGEPPPVLAVAVAIAFGAGVTLLFRRSEGVRSYFRFLTPVPVLFLVLFLFFSSATKVLFPSGVASAEGIVIGNPAPVVMIVFDEFSLASLLDGEGAIDAEAFPNIARLAGDSYWFRNAVGASDNTVYAVPAVLDGRAPSEDLLPIAGDHPQNLFTVLGGAYDMRANEPVTQLCPLSICESTRVVPALGSRLSSMTSDLWVVYRHQVLPEEWTENLPAIDQAWGDFAGQGETEGPAPSESGSGSDVDMSKFERSAILGALGGDRSGSFDAFIEAIPTEGRPTLDFLHMLLPHAPWQYLPDGTQYQGVRPFGLDHEVWDTDEWPALQAYQRVELQVQFLDRKIGRLIEKLERAGTYDETLIVLTADHGVGLRPGLPRRKVSPETFGGVGYVPLIVKAPGQEQGEVIDRAVSTLDVFPTVAEILEIDLPEQPDGVSGLSGPERDARPVFGLADGAKAYPLDQEALFEEARRKQELLGPPVDSEFRFFAAGPHRDLVGRAVADLDTGEPGEYEVALDSRALTASVDRDSGVLPALIQGQIRRDGRPPEQPVPLAVSVNGTVAGVTRSFPNVEGGVRFAAMIAPTTLRDGANRVEVFEIEGDPGRAVLRPLDDPAATADYRLEGEAVVSSEGRLPILTPARADGLTGWVSARFVERRGLVVQGWAGDKQTGEPADEALVFRDGEFVVAMPTGVDRPDVAESTGVEGLARSGFQGEFPADFEEAALGGRLRVFARLGDRLVEVGYSEGFAPAGG